MEDGKYLIIKKTREIKTWTKPGKKKSFSFGFVVDGDPSWQNFSGFDFNEVQKVYNQVQKDKEFNILTNEKGYVQSITPADLLDDPVISSRSDESLSQEMSDVGKATGVEPTQSVDTQKVWKDKDRRIARESALKTSAEANVKGITAKELIAYAKELEQYIYEGLN